MRFTRRIVGARGRWEARRVRRVAKKRAERYVEMCERAGFRLDEWQVQYVIRQMNNMRGKR